MAYNDIFKYEKPSIVQQYKPARLKLSQTQRKFQTKINKPEILHPISNR